MDPNIQISIGNFKVYNLGGTSSLVVGKATFKHLSSHTKTNNGVGNAYGDGSYINMSPYQSVLNDSDNQDMVMKKDKIEYRYYMDEEPVSFRNDDQYTNLAF